MVLTCVCHYLKFMKIKGKNIIVTGGGNGIGRELVLGLLKRGANVIAIDMNQEYLSETLNLAGNMANNCTIKRLNVADRDAVFAFARELENASIPVDGIINNAGIIQPFVKVRDLEFDDIEKVMNVNFYGTVNMVKAFLPGMLNKQDAHIVNISSMGGFLPVPGQAIYGATKAAVKLFTEALYAELLSTNVKVSVVFPGATGTNIAANSGIQIKQTEATKNSSIKALSPAKAAEIIISGMESDKFRILIGQDSRFMDFLSRLSPGFATRFIQKKMKSLLPD